VLSRAIETAHRTKDTAADVNLSALLARLLQRQSRLKEAVACYRRTIRLSRRIKNHFNEARACTNLGYLYIEQGYWHRAEVLCFHALTIFEQLDSDHGCAHTENHLGLLYTRQRRWEAAQQCLERACSLWRARGDDHGLMRGFINLGVLHIEVERPDEALLYLEKALHQAKLSGEEAEIGGIYLNIGAAYRRKGEPAQAKAYARQAEAIFRRFSNLVGLALARGNLGGACLDEGKWQEARQHLQASRQACHNLGHKSGQIKALIDIVAYELTRGNWSNASRSLNELECLINQPPQGTQYHHLQSILTEYRRSLVRHLNQQAAAN
jgi:tetratricopeptide (TPR) repeat protein